VGHYAAAIARRTGQTAEFVDILMYAAPMHDVGKIGIPDRILLKPGKLDAEEWQIMRTHTEIGAAILGGSDSEILRMAESVALTHHEKWDGSGYPRGLKGLDIPLPGQLTALADVFDALCSRRPYKEPLPVDQSLDIIRKGREQHFDPIVVDAFLSCQDDILAIKARFVDEEDDHPIGVASGEIGRQNAP
jgi:putative two-component system response regulator